MKARFANLAFNVFSPRRSLLKGTATEKQVNRRSPLRRDCDEAEIKKHPKCVNRGVSIRFFGVNKRIITA